MNLRGCTCFERDRPSFHQTRSFIFKFQVKFLIRTAQAATDMSNVRRRPGPADRAREAAAAAEAAADKERRERSQLRLLMPSLGAWEMSMYTAAWVLLISYCTYHVYLASGSEQWRQKGLICIACTVFLRTLHTRFERRLKHYAFSLLLPPLVGVGHRLVRPRPPQKGQLGHGVGDIFGGARAGDPLHGRPLRRRAIPSKIQVSKILCFPEKVIQFVDLQRPTLAGFLLSHRRDLDRKADRRHRPRLSPDPAVHALHSQNCEYKNCATFSYCTKYKYVFSRS